MCVCVSLCLCVCVSVNPRTVPGSQVEFCQDLRELFTELAAQHAVMEQHGPVPGVQAVGLARSLIALY